MRIGFQYKAVLCIFILLSFAEILTASSLRSYEQKPHVSVIDFEAKGVSANIASVTMDLFTTHLVSSDRFRVVERFQMDKILKEQEIHVSGCSDKECAVSIGRILNVRYMFYGNIIRLSGTTALESHMYYLTVYMVDIETAKIVRSERRRFSLIDDISDATRSIVDAMHYSKEKINASAGPYFHERQYGLLLLPSELMNLGVGYGLIQSILYRTNSRNFEKVIMQSQGHMNFIHFGIGENLCHYMLIGILDRLDNPNTSMNPVIRPTPAFSVSYCMVWNDSFGIIANTFFQEKFNGIFGIEPGIMWRIYAPPEVWCHVGMHLSYAYSWEKIGAAIYHFNKVRCEINGRLPILKNHLGLQLKIGTMYEYGIYGSLSDLSYTMTYSDRNTSSWEIYCMIGLYGLVYNINNFAVY